MPTGEFIQKLTAARLAADVADVPTLIIARTDALGAFLLTSDFDERDKAFCTGRDLRFLPLKGKKREGACRRIYIKQLWCKSATMFKRMHTAKARSLWTLLVSLQSASVPIFAFIHFQASAHKRASLWPGAASMQPSTVACPTHPTPI